MSGFGSAPLQQTPGQTSLPDSTHVSGILELGCGSGTLIGYLMSRGYRNVRGVDASKEQVQLAVDSGLECVTLGDAIEAISRTEPMTEDVVVAFDVLEHLSLPDVISLTSHTLRILKPGGVLILHTPNAGGIFGNMACYGDLTHQTSFTAKSLSQLLRSIGFSQVIMEEDRPIPHGVLSAVRRCCWHLIRPLFRLMYAVETGDLRSRQIFSQNMLTVARR